MQFTRVSLAEAMRPIAAAHRATVAQIALAWLLAKPGVSTVVLGASKLPQLEDNLGAIDVRLTDEEVRRLDELSPHSAYYPHGSRRGSPTRRSPALCSAEEWTP